MNLGAVSIMIIANSQSICTDTKLAYTWEITNTRKALRHRSQSLSPEEVEVRHIWRVVHLTDLKK